MDYQAYNRSLFEFLHSSPSPFHAVATMETALLAQGFVQLSEKERWQIEPGRGYFFTRSQGALVAFIAGSDESLEDGFRILAAHTDSPALKLKPSPAMSCGTFQQLAVEVYGGALLSPWFDRDLSLAGRVCGLDENGRIGLFLVDFAEPFLTIPSLAIHLDRDANKTPSINQQQHLPPLFALAGDNNDTCFINLLLEKLRVAYPSASIKEVLAFDLFCYDTQGPALIGYDKHIISAPRLDNLLSCHAGMMALKDASPKKNVLLFCANHEEIGSTSTSGAQGSLLEGVFERLTKDNQTRRMLLNNSFLVSIDNAHATHPNYLEKSDSHHRIVFNKGPVIKYNASQRYATEAASAAVFKAVCREAKIEPQEFVMRSDLPCGSTIGPMTSARLGVITVDVGAASLAMHSIREHTGARDPFLLFTAISQFLSSDIHKKIAV